MNIRKLIISLIAFSNLSLVCANPAHDTKPVVYALTFGEEQAGNKEDIVITFPTSPEYIVTGRDDQPWLYVAKDSERMIFRFMAIKSDIDNMSARSFAESIIESLKNCPGDNFKIVQTGSPSNNDAVSYQISWIDRKKQSFATLKLIKGINYMYSLGTEISDEIYLKDPSESWDKIQNDAAKTVKFLDSFQIMHG